ncbi:hypothetical protein CKO31_18190 [Thiohalocapsa halophila]|uniref:Alpha/beta hydrolase n=1 Tax=Thiohalocapsa halophila TaxID=69359 RepID=A0ABS1CMR3_9GAMM|nr:hypothetical protein [Thiohalocapsa halophila]
MVVRGWGGAVKLPFWSVAGGTLPQPFLDLLQRTLPGADILTPDLPMGTLSNADPADLVDQLLGAVDRRFEERPFSRLIIVAFSAGTVLARSFFSRAQGAQMPEAGPVGGSAAHALPRLDPATARPWADRIERIVLLAGVTRGWTLSSATPVLLRLVSRWVLFFLNTSAQFQRKGWAFIERFRRGAPFVVESRLLFHQVERHFAAAGRDLPQTVLLLGSEDEYVSPADALDLGLRKDYSYIEVPWSSHTDILDVGLPEAADTPDAGRAAHRRRAQAKRTELIGRALTESRAQLQTIAMHPDDVDDYLDDMDRPVVVPGAASAEEPQVAGVVFIIHGIRDNGFWTKRVAREVKALARSRRGAVRAPTPTYGYFSLRDFIVPWGRRDATYWFLEKFAEIRIRYPDAPVSFIGHSNGTYLAAHALELSPFVALRRVVFAGSVVRTSFDWARFGARVGEVLNLVASRDRVVAYMPGAFERLGLGRLGVDVGGGGFEGFTASEGSATPTADGSPSPKVHNFRFVAGDHGAGVSESMWRDLAAFALEGTLPEQRAGDPLRPAERTPREQRIGRIAPAVPVVALALLLAFIVAMVIGLEDGELAAAAAAVAVFITWFLREY